jgi:hypothetical protein
VPLILALFVWLDWMVERHWVRQLFSSGTSWLWPSLRSSWGDQRRVATLGDPSIAVGFAGLILTWYESEIG